jgi:hypothetical protein
MITPTILNDFGASLRAKEQRVHEWRLYGKKAFLVLDPPFWLFSIKISCV